MHPKLRNNKTGNNDGDIIFLKNIFPGVPMSEALSYIAVLFCGIVAAIIVHLLEKKGKRLSQVE